MCLFLTCFGLCTLRTGATSAYILSYVFGICCIVWAFVELVRIAIESGNSSSEESLGLLLEWGWMLPVGIVLIIAAVLLTIGVKKGSRLFVAGWLLLYPVFPIALFIFHIYLLRSKNSKNTLSATIMLAAFIAIGFDIFLVRRNRSMFQNCLRSSGTRDFW